MSQLTINNKELATIGENIGLEEGVELVQAFKQANPEAVQGYFIGRNILDEILSQPGAAGIRFRKCLYEGKESLVYTGVDAQGEDILEYTVVTSTGDIVKKEGIVADRTVWDWEVINKPKRPITTTQD